MMKKISVSFKSTNKDIALYNFLKSKDDKSFYIKEALRQVFSNEIDAELKKIENSSSFIANTDFTELENEKRKHQIAFKGEDRRSIEHTYKEV